MAEFDERVAALTARFTGEAIGSMAVIEACLTRRAWADLSTQCHSLAGRAGMFGQASLGEAARAVEEAIDAKAPATVIKPLALDLLDQLRALRQER